MPGADDSTEALSDDLEKLLRKLSKIERRVSTSPAAGGIIYTRLTQALEVLRLDIIPRLERLEGETNSVKSRLDALENAADDIRRKIDSI